MWCELKLNQRKCCRDARGRRPTDILEQPHDTPGLAHQLEQLPHDVLSSVKQRLQPRGAGGLGCRPPTQTPRTDGASSASAPGAGGAAAPPAPGAEAEEAPSVLGVWVGGLQPSPPAPLGCSRCLTLLSTSCGSCSNWCARPGVSCGCSSMSVGLRPRASLQHFRWFSFNSHHTSAVDALLTPAQ